MFHVVSWTLNLIFLGESMDPTALGEGEQYSANIRESEGHWRVGAQLFASFAKAGAVRCTGNMRNGHDLGVRVLVPCGAWVDLAALWHG